MIIIAMLLLIRRRDLGSVALCSPLSYWLNLLHFKCMGEKSAFDHPRVAALPTLSLIEPGSPVAVMAVFLGKQRK